MITVHRLLSEVHLPIPPTDNQDVAWREKAECVGEPTDLFFSERPTQMAKAKAICERCSVRSECVTEGLTLGINYDQGIRGGLSANIRNRKLRRGSVPRHYGASKEATAQWNPETRTYGVTFHER